MSAIGTIKEIGEIVQKYNDLELMKKIMALQNEVFELNQSNLNLKEELAALKSALKHKEELQLKEVGQCHYYFKANDEIPFCPKCFEGSQKLIHLPNAEPWNGGMRRDCRVCNETYWEQPMNHKPVRIVPRVGRYT